MTQSGDSERHPLRFEYFLVPNADAPLLTTAARVEQFGLEYVGMQDYRYQRRYVDTWSLLAAIATTTTTTTTTCSPT